jgi:hypothetical protein
MGACCQPDGSCTLVFETACTGNWLGETTLCRPNPCPQPNGACCFIDGSCLFLLQTQCTADWRGAGTVCEPNPCPQPSPPGACCITYAGCELLTDFACAAAHGFFLGGGTSCTPDPCVGLGACCDPTGACTVALTPADCPPPSIWHGEWLDCSVAPCPLGELGKPCCHPDGSCSMGLAVECSAPNVFHPEWTNCSVAQCPQPPAMGACCDLLTWNCTMTARTECLPPLLWYGGEPCNLITCPHGDLPMGACCNTMTGACTITIQAACNYSWLGVGSLCNHTTCPVSTPVLRKTWGRIKAGYR